MYLSAQTPFLILKSHLCSKHWNGTLGLVQNKLYVCHYHRKNLWHDQMLKCQGFNKQQKHLGACFRFIAFSLQICSKLKALPVNMSITNTRDIKRIQRITAWHGQDRGWGEQQSFILDTIIWTQVANLWNVLLSVKGCLKRTDKLLSNCFLKILTKYWQMLHEVKTYQKRKIQNCSKWSL